MLQAFIDESFSDEIPPLYVMAGFVSTAENWVAFSEAWGQVLALAPRVSHFKMNDAMRLKGEFTGWSVPQRDQTVGLLLDVIADHAKGAIYCALRQDIYRSIFKADKKLPRALKSPYFFLLYAIVDKLITNQHELGLEGPIDFIFDDHVIEKPRVLEAWNLFKASTPAPNQLLGQAPSFRDDRFVLPLQAADMVAWVVRTRMQRSMRGQPIVQLPSRSSGKPDCPMIGYSWDEDVLRLIYTDTERDQPIIATWGEFDFRSNGDED